MKTGHARSLPARRALRRAEHCMFQGDLLGAHFAFEESLIVDPGNADALLGLAGCALRRNEPDAALVHVAQALERRPADAALLHLLGRIHKARGDLAAAEAAYRQALEAAPLSTENAISLGIVLRAKGDLHGAIACYRRALAANPRSTEALVNMGNALCDLGEQESAIDAYRSAIRIAPEAPEAHVNLGRLLVAAGRFDEARALLGAARRRFPADPGVARELGTVSEADGELAQAAALYQEAAHALTGDLRAHHLYAESVRRLGGFGESIPIYRRCLELAPEAADVMNNLSVVLRVEGAPGEALQLARRAAQSNPGLVEVRASVADALTALGRADEADAIYADLVERSTSPLLTNFLLTSTYVDTLGPEALVERHRRFGARCVVAPVQPHLDVLRSDRPLRVGYLSGDLRLHSVSFFLEPVLERHDAGAFEVSCYHTQPEQDDVSARLRRNVRHWEQVERLSDEALAERIRVDGIDILVDLAGHTAGNRIMTLARKPAPIQVLWLGYPTTSGLPTMDYRITDWRVDPPGAEHLSTERLVRLADSYYCYRPLADAPPVAPSPAGASGAVTFGSFNNLAKVSPACVALWSQVLAAVPGSRLLLKARGLTDASCCADLLNRFASHGIAAERVRFEGWTRARGSHLAHYAEVDIALDTYPYNGGTTTCEALWMGVPVITLAGATHASRMGASLLHAAGMPEAIARDTASFVQKAAQLAQDRPRLTRLRAGIRAQLLGSALMDEARFVHGLEAAYREMWQRSCAQAQP